MRCLLLCRFNRKFFFFSVAQISQNNNEKIGSEQKIWIWGGRRRRRFSCYKINLFKRQTTIFSATKTIHPKTQCTFNWVWIACNSILDIIHWHWDLSAERKKSSSDSPSARKNLYISVSHFNLLRSNLEAKLKRKRKINFCENIFRGNFRTRRSGMFTIRS